ncbi:MAG: PHB depolymerase family esterase [Ginsengibacter sp.]
MFKNTFIILLLLVSEWAAAQKTYYFTKGLFIRGLHHYGREALYTDSLAYRMYTGALQPPVESGVFSKNKFGDSLIWRATAADAKNTFTSRGYGRSGYLYLTYDAPEQQNVLLNIEGNSAVYVNGILHAGDPYSAGWLNIPVILKKGLNEFYVRTYGQTVASIIFPEKEVSIGTRDSTLPYVVIQKQNGILKGAVVVINNSEKELKNYQLKSVVEGKEFLSQLPAIQPKSTRKVIFDLDASGITHAGKVDCNLILLDNKKTVDEKKVLIDAVDSATQYISTFVSNIDGSLQYYAVTPQVGGDKDNAALFLSVHGAGVEAIGQAKAYKPKDWGTLVAATNRRPRGFNWEDMGRLDALEVLAIAKEKFKPDPQRIYLTGHSMGGHGTWFLGATYPGNWAAIGPCSGYPTLKDYGSADGKVPAESKNAVEQMLLRAGNQSDVLKLLYNYRPLGIYILHGDSDKVVPVEYARQMRKALSDFHSDFSYYEYPGGEHWFGDQSVDWPHLFNFFKWHTRLPDSAVNHIDFTTSSPGISSAYRWASVIQQVHPLEYSRLRLQRDTKMHNITGSTENIHLLQLALNEFSTNTVVNIILDSARPIQYTTHTSNDTVYLEKQEQKWLITTKPGTDQKGPHRYGTFKEAFNNRMVFVYSTHGTKEYNASSYDKANYDAESWYYRGNGAVDIIADKEFAKAKYTGRNIIIYGNAATNTAWDPLLRPAPIQVTQNSIKAGNKIYSGDDLAAYFIWPQGDGATLVGVVAGTGVKGMNAASGNQYFAGGSGFPDFMIFSLSMLNEGVSQIRLAGFFDNYWQITDSECAEVVNSK